ncbi:DUF262 domain-containing protein [Marisediminicola sp. LYQ85]|uniref:DUF262 domain-containing protein n=1 Tax=Marisediminicola sp. LYQ85 TaxID=3391062 RepID=UPI0039831388
MTTATNIDATAVNTIGWLSAPDTTIVVPVYQRQYRWDIGGCEQLLADVRAVAGAHETHTHFIGSILSSATTTVTESGSDAAELVLIDGQQRVTTLMLLIAALHHTVLQQPEVAGGAELATELERVLVSSHGGDRTKLRPHRAWADVFESVVLDRREPGDELRDSKFDDNYAFFRSQVPPEEVPRIWSGLQRLEHVAITLGAEANAQQIFESLNSTGEPLRDHELIHNYVLMGLSHGEQREIEASFWLPIEENTGESIATFWRHYLVMSTGREIDARGGRAVYDAFRHEFPRLELETLRALATEWRESSAVYRVLLDPSRAPDPELARQLGYVNTFGRAMYPLVMRAYRDFARGEIDRGALIETLENIQTLLLRRTVVGLDTDRLVARLCRARERGAEALREAFARITPSDERVRIALKFGALPHPAYVLGRLAGVDDVRGLDVEHVFPLAPAAQWSGDGEREWVDYSDDEQNSHRALADSLGNLTLLEPELAERAIDASFPVKRDTLYSSSAVPMSREIADVVAWGTPAIAERTSRLTAAFLEIWAKPATVMIDDDGLTPILDAKQRRGWPRGWEREFSYVEYCGEHWEVYDVKHLFDRVFKRLWADARDAVVSFSARRGGPIFESRAWNGQWHELDESHFLYMGWDSRYMLTAVQGVLEEAGLASEVSVMYSYTGAAMD